MSLPELLICGSCSASGMTNFSYACTWLPSSYSYFQKPAPFRPVFLSVFRQKARCLSWGRALLWDGTYSSKENDWAGLPAAHYKRLVFPKLKIPFLSSDPLCVHAWFQTSWSCPLGTEQGTGRYCYCMAFVSDPGETACPHLWNCVRLTEESVIAGSSGSGSPEQIHPVSSIILYIMKYFETISCSYQTLDTHQIHADSSI